MNLSKAVISATVALTVAGCGQAQLGGPVSGSEILVDLLGEDGAQFTSGRTSDEAGTLAEVGADKWLSLSSDERFSWIGNFELKGTVFDPDRLYLMEARSGRDVDFDADGEYDEFPSDILGSWHAIVDGESLRSGGASVNLLTESAYQFIRQDLDGLSEDQVRQWLDNLAAELVGDVNGDELVDYSDLLSWDNASDREHFTGDPQLLDDLAQAVASGDEAALQAAVDGLWNSLGLDPEEFRGRFAELEQEFSDVETSDNADGVMSWIFDFLKSAGDNEGDKNSG